MNISLTDSTGQVLVLTTGGQTHTFDAVTCSPHADGFTVLNSLVGRSVSRAQLQAACDETVARNEVCVLPVDVSSKWRVLLTPTLRSLDSSSRFEASRLMNDLFRASQAAGVQATSLLITHFARVRKYPEPHVLGIFDALRELGAGSYQSLRVLCIEISPDHLPRFETNARDAFAAQPPVAVDRPQVAGHRTAR